jgi:glucan phosphoethanolaminetransferase (alkaline phosphatase superfamily)
MRGLIPIVDIIQKVINRDFLINQTPASDLQSLLPWIAVFGGLVILSVALILILRKVNPIAGKIKSMINTWMMSLGFTGLLVVFFRFQQLSIFSKNIFLAIMLVVWFIWLIFIIYWVIFRYPNQMYQFQEKERIKKYIPKARKHKK